MLIKEYRIPLPLTLEEYSIAQLYMIQVRCTTTQEQGWGGSLANRVYRGNCINYQGSPNCSLLAFRC